MLPLSAWGMDISGLSIISAGYRRDRKTPSQAVQRAGKVVLCKALCMVGQHQQQGSDELVWEAAVQCLSFGTLICNHMRLQMG